MATEEKESGLELLNDKTLASIVESDVSANDELKSQEAAAAFAELARRSGLEGW